MNDPTTTPRITKVCGQCGSEDVLADAWAAWNVHDQRWEVANVMDEGHTCGACNDQTWIDTQPVDEAEPLGEQVADRDEANEPATDEVGTTVHLNARSDHDFANIPRYAVVTVTPTLIERLRVLRSQVIANNLVEAVVWAYPEKWGGGDEDEGWRTEADQLAVSVDGFLYRTYLKHTSVLIETEFLGIDELAEGIAQGRRIFGELEENDIAETATTEAA